MNLFNALFSTDDQKLAIWKKTRRSPNILHSPDEYRIDDENNLIRFQDYGDRNSEYGWEIDHILPVSLGGSDDISNKRARHWRVNSSAGGLLGAVMDSLYRK